jgi:transposase
LKVLKPPAVAAEIQVSPRTVYRVQENLIRYGSPKKPGFRKLGRAMKLSKADEEALLEYLLQQGWKQQAEIVWWMYHERSVIVHQSTVSRLLKRREWTRKLSAYL